MHAIAKNSLSELELTILHKAVERSGSKALERQLKFVTLREREFTGVGVYVNLDIAQRKAEDADKEVKRPIDGLVIKSDDLCFKSADSIVWTDDNGYLDCIEIFGYGDYLYPTYNYEANCPEIQ